jgi:hypothetical protein
MLLTDTILQTNYQDNNDYHGYDYLSAQGLWKIEAAIDKSSSNHP